VQRVRYYARRGGSGTSIRIRDPVASRFRRFGPNGTLVARLVTEDAPRKSREQATNKEEERSENIRAGTKRCAISRVSAIAIIVSVGLFTVTITREDPEPRSVEDLGRFVSVQE